MHIPHDTRFDGPFRALTLGRIAEAKTLIETHRTELRKTDEQLFCAIASHISFHAGELTSASRLADRLVECERPALNAWAHCTLAEVAAARYRLSESQHHFSIARRLAQDEGSPPVRAFVELRYWSAFSSLVPLARASAEFIRMRRFVYSAGRPEYLAEMRLLAGRFESRLKNPIEAQRHWEVARATLSVHPNKKLEGETALDACILAFLQNDLTAAAEFAGLAKTAAKESGDFRLGVGADINAAHILCVSGDPSGASKRVAPVLALLHDHVRLRIAALDCLASIALSQGSLKSAASLFDEISTIRPAEETRFVLHWDRISELATRADLQRELGHIVEARRLLEEALRLAETNRDSAWIGKLRSALALLLLESGERDEAARLFENLVNTKEKVPELVARIAQLSGRLLDEQPNTYRTNAVGRPVRIAEALGNRYLLDSLRFETGKLASVTPVFDDATALVELAGYPHVLAREAYALLEGAGVTERLALIARGASSIRVLTTMQWDEAGARRAAADPQNRLQIVCGVHRDESWEIIADLKPSLGDRCTAVAVQQLVDTAVTLDRYRREEKQRTALWPADTFETDGGLFISEQMSDLLSSARRVASSNITVLLTGETGTGKEVLARAIHRASPRANKPFVPFNCTAVARDMLESQLFGYRRGAFTGAENAFEGVIRAAAGGTLFLDEIGEIGPELQPKLLRFLETCEVHGLGEAQPVKVDIRVIAATNGDLEALVADGRFREDLFYRLNAVWLKLPPLRERREEIPPLIDHYLRKAAEELKKGRLTLADETLEYLLLHGWPGNVRQLVNEIRRIAAFAEPDSVITPALLSPDIQASRRTIRVTEGDSPEIRVRLDQPMGDALEAIEQAMVRRALERAHGNFENAARLLGISRKGLFLKRRRWGMQRAS